MFIGRVSERKGSLENDKAGRTFTFLYISLIVVVAVAGARKEKEASPKKICEITLVAMARKS